MTTNVAVFTGASLTATLRNYVALTKPRVISLLLVTTVPAMVVADRGWPGMWLVLATLIGGSLSAAGANAINCWYDRDIDGIMKRTRSRPLVTGVIEPAQGLAFGIVLGALAFAFLALTTTIAAACLSLAALLFYVFVYTIWLKRRTSQNIVIGGAAGAFPPMVGWAAVTGDVTWASVIMFAIIFMWTPPHFWALSLRLEKDYAEAGVPMLPVTAGPVATRVHIFVYTILLLPVTFALIPAGDLGWVYGIAATALGAAFLWKAWRLLRVPERVAPLSVYKFSLLHLALLFVAMGVDAAL